MPSDWTMPNLEFLLPYGVRFGRVVLLLALAFGLSRFISRLLFHARSQVLRFVEDHSAGRALELQKRAATVGESMRKAIAVLIWAVAIAMALREVGFDIGPLIAGAGIVGIAVGFGAQSLVRDVISGAFMLVENQIRVNDVVLINGTGGLVEEINLRTTVLRSQDGAVHVFPNGAIQTLSNLTREFSYYVFDLGVSYKEDTDHVVRVIREVAEQMRQEPQWSAAIVEPLDVLGLDKFADSAVVIKARIKTRPIQQWSVGRELNRRFKKAFDQEGIEIPFPQRTLSFASNQDAAVVGGLSREELKRLIREVLAESSSAAGESPTNDHSAANAG
ncbi:MAG: mechanosensitive ion channel family protein [Bryobacteraceae bacterium]|nr:mechanosensitive ion channel family protein [Bryobacteraceae bacterium]